MQRFLGLLLCLFCVIGCNRSVVPSNSETNKIPKLKAALSDTDKTVLVRIFNDLVTSVPTVRLPDDDNSTISVTYTDGKVVITPITAEEPNKQSSKDKGIKIAIVEGYATFSSKYTKATDSQHDEGEATLDENEIADLRANIEYIQKTQKEWIAKKPSVKTIVIFKTIDGLQLLLSTTDKDPRVTISAGSASNNMDNGRLEQFDALLAKAQDTLKQN